MICECGKSDLCKNSLETVGLETWEAVFCPWSQLTRSATEELNVEVCWSEDEQGTCEQHLLLHRVVEDGYPETIEYPLATPERVGRRVFPSTLVGCEVEKWCGYEPLFNGSSMTVHEFTGGVFPVDCREGDYLATLLERAGVQVTRIFTTE